MNCQNDATCILTCRGDHSCSDSFLTVNRIQCNGKHSCRDLTLFCTKGNECQVTCSDLFSCSKLMMIGHWNVICHGNHSCRVVQAHCDDGKSCTITCSGDNVCSRKELVGLWINL